MNAQKYNPKIHHRKSIRLDVHDYSRGGLYFVTICARNEFIRFFNGKPFEDSSIYALIEKRMVITAEKYPFMRWEASVIMPDHFHALVRLEGGAAPLGEVIGGFKSAVSREIHKIWDEVGEEGGAGPARTVRARPALPNLPKSSIRIWQRNYYEKIVWDEEAEHNIIHYIRMNPWKCVMSFSNNLRGMGNPSLWSYNKLGVLCSRNAPKPDRIPKADVYIGGFHSPMEKEILARLLELKMPVIYCPAWGLDGKLASDVLKALEENRMLILEMKNQDGNLVAAEDRNRFVIEKSDSLWLPHVNSGGMLDRLVKEMNVLNKII